MFCYLMKYSYRRIDEPHYHRLEKRDGTASLQHILTNEMNIYISYRVNKVLPYYHLWTITLYDILTYALITLTGWKSSMALGVIIAHWKRKQILCVIISSITSKNELLRYEVEDIIINGSYLHLLYLCKHFHNSKEMWKCNHCWRYTLKMKFNSS